MRKKSKEKKMGRAPCCDKNEVRKGAWTPEEDKILVEYITNNGHTTWRSLPKLAGLLRCGKSCRLRWTNYLRPDIIRGPFSLEEENIIIQMHGMLGNKWSAIAAQLPGRTDNEVKNFWNTYLKKRICNTSLNLQTNQPPSSSIKSESSSTRHMFQWENARVEAEARMSMDLLNTSSAGKTGSDYFLRVWNSDVGDSFRKIKDDQDELACESSVSQASSTKLGLGSVVTIQAPPTMMVTSTDSTNKKKEREDLSSSNSYELDDNSSDGNYIDFLQDDIDDVSIYLQ